MPALEINDAIHQTIKLYGREEAIVDHPYLQRLRSIRQLGFVSLVYPSATHDRFSHTLGTVYVATLLARQILYDDSQSVLARVLSEKEKIFFIEMVRLAALLHDIGHAPFSHTAEGVMPPVSSLAIPSSWLLYPKEKRHAVHEDFSVLLIDGMTKGPQATIDKEEAEITSSLLHHKKIKMPSSWASHFSKKVNTQSLHRVASMLISSDIDADRMDYLLRDAHFAGVAYGQFDLRWLAANLGVVETEGEYRMSISEAGVHALEHYLFARYHMYIQVYMHKTVKCFEYYFQRALDEGETTYSIPSDREEYAALRDSTLLENLYQAAQRNRNSWSARLVSRNPAKRIARLFGEEREAERLWRKIQNDLKPHGIGSFLHITKRKFLDLPSPHEQLSKGKQGLFSFGIATMPMMVVRKQLGVVSVAPLADYSFILKYYHRDISIGDIYILPEDYRVNRDIINDIIKKHRTLAPSEFILREEA